MAGERIPASKWRERIAHWRSSGMSADEHAKQQGFALKRLTCWARRAQRESQGPQLLAVQLRVPATVPTEFELRSPSGWTMRVDVGTEPA